MPRLWFKMGSNGSKNVAVGSSTGAEEPATPDGNRRSHSFDLHRSAATLDRCSEGTSMGTTVRHHHVNEGLRSNQGKTFGQKIKHLTKSSTNMFERKQKKIFGSLSDAENSSSKRGNVQVEESPSSHPRIFKKNETVSQVNQPNAEDVLNTASCSRASHPNAKLRRVKSFGSSEVYSFFSSRLKRQFTSVERQQQRQTNDSPIHYAYQQEPQRSRSPNADAGGRTTYNNLSYQERQPSHAYFPQQTHCDAAFEVSNDLPTSSNTETTVSSSMSMSTSSDQSFSPRIPVLSSNPLESRASRNSRRRNTHEHHEENMSFRRTHSVGRLRDRVLRSMSTSEGSLGFLHEESAARESRRHSGRRIWESLTRSSSSRHAETTSTLAQDQLLQTLRSMNETHRQQERNASMEAAFGNPVETRRLYLEERRRRARYQVRALQRLSNSFENLAGHERSCILAGHHRTGHCTCQNIPRADNTAARANISRIIMLAEALFEVLDEIHQQSVVLSSRSSISSLGSFPAPTDIVNSMPIRVYTKEHNDVKDDTQCYICLSEYEEGDQMRVLPCHHEFHLHCIDKWLKEVHRVCPLCRGNICDGGVKNRIGVS